MVRLTCSIEFRIPTVCNVVGCKCKPRWLDVADPVRHRAACKSTPVVPVSKFCNHPASHSRRAVASVRTRSVAAAAVASVAATEPTTLSECLEAKRIRTLTGNEDNYNDARLVSSNRVPF